MTSFLRVLRALAAGAVAGALVLGFVGRVAMAAVAFGTGSLLNLSARGVFEVVILGALVGAAGGILLLVLRTRIRAAGPLRSAIAGGTLFLFSLLVSWMTGKVDAGLPSRLLPTLLVVAAVFLVYGGVADGLLTRFEEKAEAEDGPATPGDNP